MSYSFEIKKSERLVKHFERFKMSQAKYGYMKEVNFTKGQWSHD